MLRDIRFVVLLFILAFVLTACSASPDNPSMPDRISTDTVNAPEKLFFGTYNLVIDPSVPDVTIVPMRSGHAHLDILKYLLPPFCDICFYAEIEAYDPYANAYTLKLGLRNYSFHMVYDPRGIIAESSGYRIINPSGYYMLPGGIEPSATFGYIDFDSGLENRKYPPSTYREYYLQIAVPSYMSLYQVPFVIEVSYPENCREVYDMEHTGNNGYLNWGGGNLTVNYTVRDWQDDVSWVKVDATEIDGSWVTMSKTGSDTWQCVLHNLLHNPVGTYYLTATAYSPNGEGRIILDYFDVDVDY